MKSLTTLLLTILASFAIIGCSPSPSSLVGTYAVEEGGEMKEFIRIEKKGDKFTMSEKQSGRWLTPVEVSLVSKADFEKMLKESVTVDFTGLGNNNVAIMQVPKGWRSGTFESKTGIWLVTGFGPIELHQQ